MKNYRLVEVPLVGYALAEKPFTFGYKDLFEKEFSVKTYLADEKNKDSLEGIIGSESRKALWKTLVYGVGTAGTAMSASSGVVTALGIICGSGGCPLWLAPIYLSLAPFAWIPLALTGGFLVTKRLGQRRALQEIHPRLKDTKIIDYNPIMEHIEKTDLSSRINEYYLDKISGTRWEKFQKAFKKNPEMKAIRKEIAIRFGELSRIAGDLKRKSIDEEHQLYEVVEQTYNYIQKCYDGKWLKRKKAMIFGI